MMNNRRRGPWPELRNHVKYNRRWFVGVEQAGAEPEIYEALSTANYFICPRELPSQRDWLLEMEHVQDIGWTNLTNEEIRQTGTSFAICRILKKKLLINL